MLEPVRQYAAERLRAAGERDEIARRHLAWVVRFASAAGRGFLAEQLVWSARLRGEHDNIRQALEVALTGIDREAALRITGALGYVWYTMGQPDGRRWVTRALDAATGMPDRLRARALLAAGMLDKNALDYELAVQHLREAIELFRRLGNPSGEAWAVMSMGRAAWSIDVEGRPASAWFEQALRIFREVGEPAGIGWTLAFHATESYYETGDLEAAKRGATEALEVGTASGVLGVVAESRRILALVAAMGGEHDESARLFEQAVDALEQAGDDFQLGSVLTTRAFVAWEQGDVLQALVALRKAFRLARAGGSAERIIYALTRCVPVLWDRRRAQEAALLLGVIDTSFRRLPRGAERFGVRPDVAAAVSSTGLDEHRIAGRSLSLERAADLALRVLDEELAAASAAEVREGDGTAGIANTSRRGGR